jgi:arginine utilization protein RocB
VSDKESKGVFSHLWDRVKAIPGETMEMLERKTSQGAAEVSHALFSQSNAYVPYGDGQKPLETEGPQMSYQDMIREASQRGGPDQEHGQEMER